MAKRTVTKHVKMDWYGDEIAHAVQRAMEPGLWAMGDAVRDRAVGRAPRRSGRLKESAFIATEKRTDYQRGKGDRRRRQMTRILSAVSPKAVLVGFAVWYSNLFEDTGAKSHGIPYVARTSRARRRKTLQIPGIGFRKAVVHPGFGREPFLAPALEAAKGEAAEEFAAEVRRRLERELGA